MTRAITAFIVALVAAAAVVFIMRW